MISYIPANTAPQSLRQTVSMLLQPVRYAWELAVPRGVKRLPVLSSCWIVDRRLADSSGGFTAVSRSITPEHFFAQAAAKENAYYFMQSGPDVGLTSNKNAHEQWDTAVRTRYPQVHRRPELVLLLSLLQLLFLVLPFAIVLGALVTHNIALLVLSAGTTILLSWTYVSIVQLTYQTFQWRSLIMLPFASCLDIYLRNYSMWQYEFREVIWKGRDVTPPVMHVIPRLPEM